MFDSWGRFAYRHRRIVPAVIIAIIALLYVLAGANLGQKMSQEGWEDPNSSSAKAQAIEMEKFGRDNNGDVIVVFHAADGHTVDEPAAVAGMASYLEVLKASYPDQIAHINSYSDKRAAPFATKDKKLAFAAIGLRGDGGQTLKDFRVIKDDLVPESQSLPGGITVEIAGATAIADALDAGMSQDIHRAEIYALPAVAVLLIIVFGSVVAAGMPLIVGILSILGSLGVLSVLASFTQVNVFAQSVVTLLGLGLAIDYGLFMVSRFREELDHGATVPDAVATTTATAGKTVVFSAGMVAVALSGLFIFPQAFLKSIAYGAISAVGLAALLSLTVLPCIFGLLGTKIDVLTVRRKKRSSDPEKGFFGVVPAWAIKHSTLVTVGLVGALLVLTIPLAGVSFGGLNETYLPPNNKARVAQAHFDEQFPTFRTEPVKLVVAGADSKQLADIYRQANTIGGFTSRFSPSSETKDGTTVLSAGIADRDDNTRIVHALESIEAPDGVQLFVGGTPAIEVESIEALFDKLPWMALYVILATFILMSLAFGSMILPAKAIIMTILGLGATLGILTLMFVAGVGAGVFNFTPGPLMSPVMVLIMAIVYGLSTDYEVFLVSRMVEAREAGASTDRAIRYGTAHTGSIITAAAVIMIVVCGAFGFSQIVMMKYIAFGMIAALILDATVIRMMLVPAVMHLLREDNWWAPLWVKRVSAKLSHGASAGPAPIFTASPDTTVTATAHPPAMADVAPGTPVSMTGSPAAAEPGEDSSPRGTTTARVSSSPRPVRPTQFTTWRRNQDTPDATGLNSRPVAGPSPIPDGASVPIPREDPLPPSYPQQSRGPWGHANQASPQQQGSPQAEASQPQSAQDRGSDTQLPNWLTNSTADADHQHPPAAGSVGEKPAASGSGLLTPIDTDVALRGGRTTADDDKLIPFSELKEKIHPHGPNNHRLANEADSSTDTDKTNAGESGIDAPDDADDRM